MSTKEKITIEQYIKDNPPQKIHDDFISYVEDVLKRSKLQRKTYFNSIADQLAAKCIAYLPKKGIVYKMECKDGIWGYQKYKLEAEKSN